MELEHQLNCLEKRIRELETAQAVSVAHQKNNEKKLDEFTETTTIILSKQNDNIDSLKRFMYLGIGVILALQALGLIK